MDVLIREVNPRAIQKIDELARKKGISRNQYLKKMIEDLTVLELKDTEKDRLEKQIELNSLLMKQTSESLDEFVFILKELLHSE